MVQIFSIDTDDEQEYSHPEESEPEEAYTAQVSFPAVQIVRFDIPDL